jgi:hypothetical protein
MADVYAQVSCGRWGMFSYDKDFRVRWDVVRQLRRGTA